MAKAILLQIEVHPAGLQSARMEIQEFLSLESTRTAELAPLAEVWLRKLLRQADREIKRQEREARQAEAEKPKPSIRQVRGKLAA